METDDLLGYLRTLDAPTLLDWLRQYREDQLLPAKPVNWWLHLAVTPASRCQSQLDLQWCEVSIVIYEQLARDHPDDQVFLHTAMMRRAFIIDRLGAVSGDPLRDPEVVMEWFWNRTPHSPRAIAPLVPNWQSLPIEQIRQFRSIKNRLDVVRVLVDRGHIKPDPLLQSWLDIQPDLS
jgi:hypothetical protein